MFVYLSKKIAIPNNHRVRGLAWSREHGFIACGGEDGLLKVLKLEALESEGKVKGLAAAAKNLSMNQTLEGHSGTVENLCWNEPFQKLTSSDQNGLIIVWMLYKGSWYEEMVNNRNKSVVRGMSWTYDGQKICIVYEDGAVIVGSVDGNRLWGKELKGMRLSQVEWSPDGQLILFGVLDSEVHVYDQTGNFLTKVPLPATQGAYGRLATYGNISPVVGIKWFNNVLASKSRETPSLAIAFESGRIQLMRYESDDTALVFDAELRITSISWNMNGTILAVTGSVDTESDNKRNFVKFYSNLGDLVQTLRVPGKEIYSSSWEREGLRIGLAVDCYIFFANIRPEYKWCYFSSTVVYTLNITQSEDSSSGPGEVSTVVFWHIPSDSKHVKSVRNLLQISSHYQQCAIATKYEDSAAKKRNWSSLIVCNSIGTPVDMTNIELLVTFLAINSTRVIAASKDSFCVWRFKTPSFQVNAPQGIKAQRMTYSEMGLGIDSLDIDDEPLKTTFISRNDPIVSITCSEKSLIVAQESGTFHYYLLPNCNVIHKCSINTLISKMALNKDSSKLSIIDSNGNLFFYDFEDTSKPDSNGKLLEFEKHDVWDMKWASDDVDMIAITEKTKLCVFNMKPMDSEDPIVSSGHICSFSDLTVITVLLDELVNDSSQADDSSMTTICDHVIDFETKSLSDARKIVEEMDPNEAINYIEKQSHPRLWKLLCQSALDNLALDVAELSLVKLKDYKGIQFVKRIKQLNNDSLKRAEVFAFNGKFKEAERVYIDIDRKDLAIELRKTLGQYHRVVELLKSEFGGGDDIQMRDALCNLGDQCADNHNWEEAVVHYERCNAYDRLFECYCLLENYDGLKKLVKNFNDNHPILVEFGRTFESVGMCREAVQAYVRARKVDLAISCCVTMSEWKMAIDLAHEYDVPDIDSLLSKYAEHLISKEKFFDVVELYRKANKISEATTMLLKIIEDTKKDKKADPLLMKKLYTLVGLLHEENRKAPNRQSNKSNALNALLNEDLISTPNTYSRVLDEPWKGMIRDKRWHRLVSTTQQLNRKPYISWTLYSPCLNNNIS